MKKQIFNIEGMTCASCQAHIQNAVEKQNGVKSVNVNLLSNNMSVEYDESICSSDDICENVKKEGYKAYISNKNNIKQKTNNSDNSLKKQIVYLIISSVLLFAMMYFSMGHMMWGWKVPNFLSHHKNPLGYSLIQFLILLPILIINNSYFINGFKRLFKGSPNMDSLIAVGSSVSVIYGIIGLFIISYSQSNLLQLATESLITSEKYNFYLELVKKYSTNLYWESSGMILIFVSLGRLLEKISTKKTTNSITKLLNLAPKTATIIADGIEKEIGVENVKVNDIIIVKKGFAIPVDGEIIEGQASINESNITGESIPVFKTINESVYCSTIVENGYLKIKASKVGEDSTFSNIIKLVEEASNSKAPISKLADKISGIFVPIIFSIAIFTFIINLLVHHSFELALNFALTTIVIACPCALGLATPVAIMVGIGKGAENGLLIRNAEIMEKAHYIKTIVLDKTGTITEGKPKVVYFETLNKNNELDKQEIINIIYSLEKKSEHPLAKSLVEYASSLNSSEVEIKDFKSLDGYGIVGKYKYSDYYIGNIKYLEHLEIKTDNIDDKISKAISKAEIPLILLKDKEIEAVFSVKDNIKEDSKLAINLLKKMNIDVIMLTGDNKKTSNIIANEVGIDNIISEVKPQDKQSVISNLKNEDRYNKKHLIAMVGDGVNDAPALESADVGISIGSGSDVAIETSDIVLLKNSLLDVVNAIKLSKRIFNTIKVGLFWAFFYNSICVLIATGLFYGISHFMINPMIGVIAMSISSVSVVLNALTINFFKPYRNNKTNNIENNNKKEEKQIMNKMEFYVHGMMCQHCENHIRQSLENAGAKNIEIDLTTKKITISTNLSKDEVWKIIKETGYEATEK